MTFVASTLKSQRGKAGGGIGPEETLIAGTLKAQTGRGWAHDAEATYIAAPLSHGSNPNSNMAGRRREDDESLVAYSLRSNERNTSQGNANYVASVSENQRGELLETDVAHQLTAGGGKPGQGYSAVREGASVRRLTPTECLRLQGLPDDWFAGVEPCPDSRMYAGLGDAVTSNVGFWMGSRIARAVGAGEGTIRVEGEPAVRERLMSGEPRPLQEPTEVSP